MQCDQTELLSIIEAVPIPDFSWLGDHSAFLKKCTDLDLEWAPKAPRCSDEAPMFGDCFERCPSAVSVA